MNRLAIYNALKERLVIDKVATYVEESIQLLIEERKFPCINIQILGQVTTASPGISPDFMQRTSFSVRVFFGKTFPARKYSREDATLSPTGLWALYDQVRALLDADPSLGGIVLDQPIQPEIQVECTMTTDRSAWIGVGTLSFKVYTDERVYR